MKHKDLYNVKLDFKPDNDISEPITYVKEDVSEEALENAKNRNYTIKRKKEAVKQVVTTSQCSRCTKVEFSATAELARVYMLLSENVAPEEILALLRMKYDWTEIDRAIEHKKKSITARQILED